MKVKKEIHIGNKIKKTKTKTIKKDRISNKEILKHHIKKLHPKRIKDTVKNIKRKNKILFTIIVSLSLIFFLVFSTRAYLFFNFLVGHDTIVKLTSSQQDFFMKNSETDDIEFEIYVSTNLFCEVTCDYTFEDISNGYVLDKNNFSTKLSNPNSLSYSLVAPQRGEGQNLYHFEVSCKTKKTTLCRTDEEEKKRSYLVALNYELSEEQLQFKEESSKEIQEIITKTDELEKIKIENDLMDNMLQEYIIKEGIAKDNLSDIESELDKKIDDWKKFNYEIILRENLFEEINMTEILLIGINNNLTELFERYNNFKQNLTSAYLGLESLSSIENLSIENYDSIATIIGSFNRLSEDINKTFNLSIEEKNVETILEDINYTNDHLNITGYTNYTLPTLIQPDLTPLERPFLSNYSSGRILQSEEPMCCYKGDCEICCTDNCREDPTKYPILLVHGHSFNDAVSAESSIGDLRSIQEELTKDGVIDGGYIILNNIEDTGTFARTNRQIVFASSYYFDIYQNKDSAVTLQTKADSLDTYALRLNDIVENVKKITNRDKVYIIAHSMGGLVTRRYMQIFGDDSVEKLVMIGTPNHGIDGYVLSTCPIFGANSHCRDMDKDSLFINKLNYGSIPKINTSVIIGMGCKTDGVESDGIVKNESAYLTWATDYYVNGTCNGVSFLHQTILDVDKYPDTYKYIKQELNL